MRPLYLVTLVVASIVGVALGDAHAPFLPIGTIVTSPALDEIPSRKTTGFLRGSRNDEEDLELITDGSHVYDGSDTYAGPEGSEAYDGSEEYDGSEAYDGSGVYDSKLEQGRLGRLGQRIKQGTKKLWNKVRGRSPSGRNRRGRRNAPPSPPTPVYYPPQRPQTPPGRSSLSMSGNSDGQYQLGYVPDMPTSPRKSPVLTGTQPGWGSPLSRGQYFGHSRVGRSSPQHNPNPNRYSIGSSVSARDFPPSPRSPFGHASSPGQASNMNPN